MEAGKEDFKNDIWPCSDLSSVYFGQFKSFHQNSFSQIVDQFWPHVCDTWGHLSGGCSKRLDNQLSRSEELHSRARPHVDPRRRLSSISLKWTVVTEGLTLISSLYDSLCLYFLSPLGFLLSSSLLSPSSSAANRFTFSQNPCPSFSPAGQYWCAWFFVAFLSYSLQRCDSETSNERNEVCWRCEHMKKGVCWSFLVWYSDENGHYFVHTGCRSLWTEHSEHAITNQYIDSLFSTQLNGLKLLPSSLWFSFKSGRK